MTSTAEEKAFLGVAVAAIPRVTEIIQKFPSNDQAGALETAERSFLAATLDYGCTEIAAQSRLSVLMRRLRGRLERQQAGKKSSQSGVKRSPGIALRRFKMGVRVSNESPSSADTAPAVMLEKRVDRHLHQSRNRKSERHAITWPPAQFAMEQIRRYALPAEPSSFELWFNYATGTNSELNRAIDEAIAGPHGLTEAKFDQLCDSYLSAKRKSSSLNAVATGLSDEIAQVMGMITAAAVSTEVYEKELSDGLVSFGQFEGYDAVKPVVEALVVATRQMEAETQTLNGRLERSQSTATRLQREVELLRKENLTDPLTLIGNRQHFDDTLTHLAAAASQTNKPLSLLFCDIDYFKDFNDKYGHQVGDEVLRLVAGLIKNHLRNGDLVARYGGEEFGIILPDTSLDVAKMIAERIRAALAAREVKKRNGNGSFGRVTISIGVAQLRLNERPHNLVKRADACLYAAKKAGRDRVATEPDLRIST